MGGATAIDFTLAYPQAVKQLILINSVGFSGDFPLGRFLFPPLDYLAVEYWRQRKLQALFLGEAFGNLKPGEIEAKRCAVLHLEMSGWCEAMISFTKSGGYSNLADKIARIDKPTLILWGDQDRFAPPVYAQDFSQLIKGSDVEVMPDAGHLLMLEHPDAFAGAVSSFLKS